MSKQTIGVEVAVFDLDGCLADDTRRLPLIDSCGFEAYHKDLENDPVINRQVLEEQLARNRQILFITARPEHVRDATMEWLHNVLGVCGFMLLMRPAFNDQTSPVLKIDLLREWLAAHPYHTVKVAFDDRVDVIRAYIRSGLVTMSHVLDKTTLALPECHKLKKESTAADVLANMADTFRERNKVYGDNYKRVAKLMAVLFPDGVPSELVIKDQFHLFELLIVKLSRFAVSNLTHQDSIHDAAVYAAMIESILINQGEAK